MRASILRSSGKRCTRKSPLKILTPCSTAQLDSCWCATGWMKKPPPSENAAVFLLSVPLQRFHRCERDFSVYGRTRTYPSVLPRLLPRTSLPTICERVAFESRLKEDSDLILAFSSAQIPVIHANPGHIAGFCLHRLMRCVVSPPPYTVGAPDAKRQMRCLVGFPVGQAWRPRVTSLSGMSGLLPWERLPNASNTAQILPQNRPPCCSAFVHANFKWKRSRQWNGPTESACGNCRRCLWAVSPMKRRWRLLLNGHPLANTVGASTSFEVGHFA